ncbi:MAG: helix-turn-helix domain-containing protein [Planctomycetota bacterium]|nr:helix-turn-helix domain-containing protein [Planctomycetota bacterium]
MSGSAVAQTPYERLLLEFAPRTIRSQAQYERVLRQVDRLMRSPKSTRAEDDLLELLASLVTQYEQVRFPAAEVTPGEMVAHLIESRGVTKAEVAAATGFPTQTITHFVNGSRAICKASRAKLAKYFHVSPDLFL